MPKTKGVWPHVIAATALALATIGAPVPAQAQSDPGIFGTAQPGIWIDPDGCQHWVADGGVEGYMEGRVNPHTGLPVCLDVSTCAMLDTTPLFEGNTARLTPTGRAELQTIFVNTGAYTHDVYVHTDQRNTDRRNMALSARRADAITQAAAEVGVPVNRPVGAGARQPAVSLVGGAQVPQNNRVQIICYHEGH